VRDGRVEEREVERGEWVRGRVGCGGGGGGKRK